MRTIASTVGTRGEAETAVRRLEAIGITPDRIQLKEVAEPQPGVFISVKVSPEQVGAATEILKSEAAPPLQPAPASLDRGAAESSQRVRVSDPAPHPTPPITRTSAAPARAAETSDRGAPPVSRSAATAGKPLGRLIFMALALAAFGFALGAILGTFT